MPAKRQSKAQYLKKRKARVRDLYINERLEPRDIVVRLLAEGAIETSDESLESAIRLVRGDVKELRQEIDARRAGDATVTFNELDALEDELANLRKEHARQTLIADGEPREMCARSSYPLLACPNTVCEERGKHLPFVGPAIGISVTNTPQGPMTTYKALWPAGVRQKASKDAAILKEKISKLEVALSEKRRAIAPTKSGSKHAAAARDDVFEIVTSGKPTNELISANAAGEIEN